MFLEEEYKEKRSTRGTDR